MALRVSLGPRGGGPSLADLPFSALSFGRLRNDVSTASVTVPVEGMSGADRKVLGQVGRWTHEVAVWDEAEDDEPAWVGPCTDPSFTQQAVTLGCKDLFAWFDHRLLPTDRDFDADDLAQVFAAYAADALSEDPSPNITVSPSATGVRGDRQVRAAQYLYAGDQMRELVRSGVDFTVLGREVLVFERDVGGLLPALTADSLDGATLAPSGADPATEAVVLGTSLTASDQVVGRVAEPGHRDGLLQVVRNEAAVRDEPSARHAAAGMLDAGTMTLSGTL